MPTTEDYWIGQVPALVRGKPVKLSVRYQCFEADSADPTNEWPHFYTFIVDERSDLLDHYELAMTSTIHHGYLKDAGARNRFAVTYGLRQIKLNQEQQSIRVTSSEYQEWEQRANVNGMALQFLILDFLYRWYEYLPQESFAYPDFMINMNARERDIRQWLQTLIAKKFIIHGQKRAFDGRLGFKFSTTGVKINPEKDGEVRKALGEQSLHVPRESHQYRVFISYNTKDKILAGKLSEILEAGYEVTVFLAHQKLQVSEEWRLRILEELDKCDAVIALVTKNFKTSKWTDQEVGIALGKQKNIVPVIGKKKLHGFLEGIQGTPLIDDLSKLAKIIATDLSFAPKTM